MNMPTIDGHYQFSRLVEVSTLTRCCTSQIKTIPILATVDGLNVLPTGRTSTNNVEQFGMHEYLVRARLGN